MEELEENNQHYKRIVSKYGDIKNKIILLIQEKNYEEITNLWNKIRTEARFLVSTDIFEKNATYYMYCGTTLQEEIINILKSNGITQKEYGIITEFLV